MKDVYDATIVCDRCNKKTIRSYVLKDGFKIRIWSCPECKAKWYHPGDMEEYREYKELRDRRFNVKLRQVGNSWAVSIPKEIIEFEEVKQTKIVRISLDEPGKITLSIKKIRKIY
ncbi:MAG: hypothetical protein U9Q69_04415 [Nanoarchaeota archaeon]|nr:hypothetical protein [Nanoarchaeota archaeon]